MLGAIELIGEIGSSLPYLYRAWFWLASSAYRVKLKNEYLKYSTPRKSFDIAMSLLFFALECWGIVVGVGYLVAENT